MKTKGIKIRVSGRVQGVFFRSNTKEKALELGLSGWVKNEPNGDVLILAEGPEQKIFELIEWAKEGPELSIVDNISHEWIEPTGEFSSFSIKH